jgi:signal transduction histidine kinase
MYPEFIQAAQIGWSADRQLTIAEGACDAVLGAPSEALLGKPLHVVLGVTEARAAELDQLARAASTPTAEFVSSRTEAQAQEYADARVFRLVLGTHGGQAVAGVTDLSAALVGAPPVQISRLSSSLSHEIRNPLSSVKMAVQTLAKNTTLSERDQRRLTIANREIRTIERMLWLLSEYGRDTPPMVEPMPLRVLVQEVAALIEAELLDRKIAVHVEETDENIPRVRVDAGRLRPVLSQVFLNVAAGLPPNSTVTLRLRTSPRGGSQLVIHDPTATLVPEERATLFEPFGSKLARGAGLSLAALHRVMTSLGGTLEADGDGTPGTRLTLTFPP